MPYKNKEDANAAARERYRRDPAKKMAAVLAYRARNREVSNSWSTNWVRKNPEKVKARWRKYSDANKMKLRISRRAFTDANRDRINARNRELSRTDPSRRERARMYRLKNRSKFNAYRREWSKRRIKIDPVFRLALALRGRVREAFRQQGWGKRHSANKIVGADWITVKKWIEEKFKPGMSWDNHGKWHIDHVKPLASASDENQLRALCHYKNLQPLWAEENIRKGSKCKTQ